jgi:gliding motility-associated-like protein
MKYCLMRSFLLCIVFALSGTLLTAQPANDDCSGLVNLGALPACPDDIFTNIDATPSNIGFGNSPACFNGGTTQNDVWFSFTTSADIIDVTVTVLGIPDGPNNQPLINPQIALYRGDCQFDGLAELSCVSAPNGSAQVQLDILGLTPNETYFIRINDYSPSATPNWGDFTLCVDEYVPAINMGESSLTTACFGTLYDSGGPDGAYGNNENLTFTICPNDFHSCIEINILDFVMENFTGFFGDRLNFYAGNSINAPLIASVTGNDNGQGFPIQATSSCVTVQFISDGSVTFPGFELTWQCTPLACDGSTPDNPTVINSLPFTQNGVTTCDGAATFATTACTQDAFLNGPEYVFAYDSPGGICAQIQVTGALGGTGVLVLNGPPDDPNTTCVAQSPQGTIGNANFQTPGTYYIIVANAAGCTNFDISITETDCALSPALVDALCNPLNGCIEDGGVPSIFNFEDGFQDMDIVAGVNDGCWLGVGAEPDFYWFSIQAQADGPFGFILESADFPSDIDFSVWGPFTQQEVCETPNLVVNFIANNQPIRSSWAAGADPTGLADIHPVLGTPVTDVYDCGDFPGAGGDDFVSTISCQEGEVYVVLVNDWGNQIGEAGISVDWSPSAPEVLAPPPIVVLGGDTAICSGESVQIILQSAISSIVWVEGTATLSCTTCPDPIATPLETTVYKAVVDAVCYQDTVEVRVVVFDVNAGPDVTVCRGQEYEIVAGSNYENATYQWAAPANVQLSCTDCPNPTVTSEVAGTYTLSATLFAPNCTLTDEMVLTVSPFDAPDYGVADDQEICAGDAISIGGPQDPNPNVTYTWTSNPAGFSSGVANPSVNPSESTQYFLTVTGGDCPNPIVDSVLVEVVQYPVISVPSDTSVCQEEPILLSNTVPESDVVYMWTGPSIIEDPADPNSPAFPQSEGTYTLTASRGDCAVAESFDVTITEIAIDILPTDTLRICRGEQASLVANVLPSGVQATWTPNDGSLSSVVGNSVVATPQTATTYSATVNVPGCSKTDFITILVDSLPSNLAIMPADTMICQGEIIVLQTPPYEPSDFPNIEFLWTPNEGAQSPDTLFNFVVTPNETVTYARIAVSGVCADTSYATVNVTPSTAMSVMPSDTLICAGQPVQFTVEVPGEVEEISWMPAGGLSCTDCLEPVATPSSTTTYMVSAEFMGCPLGASATINVRQLPRISLNTQTVICLGESVTLNLQFDQFTLYTWTSTDPEFGTVNDPAPVVSPTETTTYFLVADNGICDPVQVQLTIEVVGEVSLEVSSSTESICQGDQVTLTATPQGGSSGDSFIWNTDTGNTFFGAEITDSPSITTTYTVTYIAGSGCDTLTASLTVNVDEGFEILDIEVDPMEYEVDGVPLGEEVTLTVITDPEELPGATFTWSANGEALSQTGRTITDIPLADPTVYSVTVVNAAGCPETAEISIDVIDPEFDLPNAFTPNGDGRNDFFKLLYTGSVEIVDFKVYNRWGQIVHDSRDPQGWDGNYNGKPAPSDVYVYRVRFRFADGREFTREGDVTLLR